MSASPLARPSEKGSTLVGDSTVIRVVVANFLLLALLFWPPVSAEEQQRVLGFLRSTGTRDLVFGLLDLWGVASSVLATVLLVRRFLQGRKLAGNRQKSRGSVIIDATLVLAWWVTLLGLCLYGFILGHAG